MTLPCANPLLAAVLLGSAVAVSCSPKEVRVGTNTGGSSPLGHQGGTSPFLSGGGSRATGGVSNAEQRSGGTGMALPDATPGGGEASTDGGPEGDGQPWIEPEDSGPWDDAEPGWDASPEDGGPSYDAEPWMDAAPEDGGPSYDAEPWLDAAPEDGGPSYDAEPGWGDGGPLLSDGPEPRCTGEFDQVSQAYFACPPDFTRAAQWSEICPAASIAVHGYLGSCEGLLALVVSPGTWGKSCFYDPVNRALVGAVAQDDVPTFCERTSWSIAAGRAAMECPLTQLADLGDCLNDAAAGPTG